MRSPLLSTDVFDLGVCLPWLDKPLMNIYRYILTQEGTLTNLMLFYRLILSVVTPDADYLPQDIFDKLPRALQCVKDTSYLEHYHDQALSVAHRRRRRSSRKHASINRPNVPPTPIHSPKQHSKRSLDGRPDFRLGPLSIDAIDFDNEGKENIETINCGFGILHLYREHDTTPNEDGSTATEDDSTLLCILAIPSYITTLDFIKFINTDKPKQCRIIK